MLYFNNSYPYPAFGFITNLVVNPLDITLGIAFVSLIYFSSKNYFKAEIVKLVGSFIALILSFHYYAKLGQILKKFGFAPQDMHELFALVFIAGAVLLSFSVLEHT